MTSRERVLAAMRREQPDRMPINIRGARVWEPDWVATRDRSYRPLIDAVLEHCDVIPHPPVGGLGLPLFTRAEEEITETLTVDAGDWTIHRAILHTPKGDLSQDYWESKLDYLPLTKSYFLKRPEDVDRALSVPYVAPPIALSEYFQTCERWPANLTMCNCPQASECVHDLLGSETFAYWWVEHRSLLFRLLEAFEERVLAAVEFMLQAGAGPVFATNGSEQIAPPLHAPQTYREFVLPHFRKLTRRIHERGGMLHVHCHNRVSALLEDFVEAGWDITHPLEPPPMGDVDLADAKRRVGKQLCLEGNIQIGELYAAPTERVTALVEEAIMTGRPGGGFILCPSASPHTPALSHLAVSNYLAMIETGVKLRDY